MVVLRTDLYSFQRSNVPFKPFITAMVIYPWLKVVGLSVSTVTALYCTVLLLLLNVGLQRQ